MKPLQQQPVIDGLPQVFVVDDDHSILTAFARLLGAAGFKVQTFASSTEFLARHDPSIPGCALLDIRMDDMDGLALQAALATGAPMRPIIFITGCDDARTSVRALKAGAIDYLTKPVDAADLISAVETAIATDLSSRTRLAETRALTARYERLTPREREVMALLLKGMLNKQIAHELGTVEKTVKVHRARVLEKMEVRSVAALVHIAETMGRAGAHAGSA